MADNSEIMADAIVPSLEEIQNMKVADLRKKLKTFGLSTAGNKMELIERLQEAYLTSKGDSFDSSHLTFDESQIIELDNVDDNNVSIEEGALLDQDQFSSYLNSTLDDTKVLASPEKSKSSPITMPPKKRNLSNPGGENGTVVEKKMLLNRTNVAHNTDFNFKTETESKKETPAVEDKAEEGEKKVLSVKSMTASERLAMRAKRFNMSNANTVATPKNLRTTNKNSEKSIISSATAPDLDVLKKRAERFGQSVSTVMKQLEHKEKLLKRKCKFGANLGLAATSSVDEQEKKRSRAERFGIS